MTFVFYRRQFPWIFIVAFLFIAAAPQIQTYDQLLHAIREVRTVTQQRIEQAVEQEKVREAWETGKLIQQHILLNKDRANYGDQVLERLALDLATSKTELYRMLEFARLYPNVAPAQHLSWAQYRELIYVKDPAQRASLIEESGKGNWDRQRLRREIRKRRLATAEDSGPELIEINPGKIGTYRVVKLKGQLKIDLGFETYYQISQKNAKSFKEGNILSLSRESGNFEFSVSRNVTSDLYTYTAQVTQITDGDTFYALIDLGLGITLQERLRLRRLDAPELISGEGKQAQKALEKILMQNKGAILIKIEKSSDQHGRYIADVWVKNKDINPELLKTGFFTVRENE